LFNSYSGEGGGWVQLGPLRITAANKATAPAPAEYDDGEIGGMMIVTGNRSTRIKPASVPLCPPQTPYVARTWTRAAVVGSQRLTAWAMARSCWIIFPYIFLEMLFHRVFSIDGPCFISVHQNWFQYRFFLYFIFDIQLIFQSCSHIHSLNFLFLRNLTHIFEKRQHVLYTSQESCYISDDNNKIVTSFRIQSTHRLWWKYIFTSASLLPITNGKQSHSKSNFDLPSCRNWSASSLT
jgi:hypothetical protein